jgi:restriction system protein
MFYELENITPEEFEEQVRADLLSMGGQLKSFTAEKRALTVGLDGEYEIDVLAKFEALGAQFVVVVECKKHKNAIKREDVQVLHSKMLSLGAQKAMLFATAEFQSGALEFARAHGIALVGVSEGHTAYRTKSLGPTILPPGWPKFVSWLVRENENGNKTFTLVGSENPEVLAEMILSK